MSFRNLLWTAACALLASIPLTGSAAPRYTLTFIPEAFEPGPFHPLNDAGRIAGTYQGRVALFDRAGIHPVDAPPSLCRDVNDRSDVTGLLTGSATAFAIIGGRLVDIHATLPTFYYTSDGEFINNRGSVAGIADPFADEAVRGFLYRHGHSQLVPTLGGEFSFVAGLNNKDGVVGWASTGGGSASDPQYHAIFYKDRKTHDLGTLASGQRSQAFGINDRWQIVGTSRIAPDDAGDVEHPFLFQYGRMIDLGTLGGSSGRALAINNGGLIVGEASRPDDTRAAFLYLGHKMLDLNQLAAVPAGWQLVTAQDINNRGQIVATACYGFGGQCLPVRLDPACPCRAADFGQTDMEALPDPE
jgi:probable HAF family extracellular repeat protein